MRETRVVTPGEIIAVIEEFFAGRNAYVSDGYIIARRLGRIVADMKDRVIDVSPLKTIPIPQKGETVYGVVTSIRDPLATIDVFYVEDRNKPLPYHFSGLLHATNVSSSYVKTLYNVVGYGAVVRAKVIEGGALPLELSLKGRDYGVIYAKCAYCMRPLRKRELSLYCPSCRASFRRKVSSRYMVK